MTIEATTDTEPKEKGNIPGESLIESYRLMLLSRMLDEKMLVLLKQGQGYFHIGASGHEAAQIAAAHSLKGGIDWSYPYYRDLTFVLALGMTPEEAMLCFLHRAENPSSGGRQMPGHYGHKDLRIVSQSSPTGTQYLQAVGTALGIRRRGADELVYVSSGEGATSQGDFHEALNWASREMLPVVFFIEDNKYAISVHVSEQTAGGSVYDLVSGYKGLTRYRIDGTDFINSSEIMKDVVGRVRSGEGPALVVADVVRLLPHSSSDDQRKYRPADEIAVDIARDPIERLKKVLLDSGAFTSEREEELREEMRNAADAAAEYALGKPMPDPSTATKYVYDESGLSDSFEYESSEPSGEAVVIVDAINHALHEEMERDPDVLVFGQDVADDKGGVFTATRGLSKKFGKRRAFNSPLAESSIIGVAIGLALQSFKPVVEIQFADYIWTAMMQIRNELATMRYRSDDAWKCPVVVRVPCGGYIHGGLYHSQNIEGIFAHVPGIRIAFPSNAADAKGLLKTAIRGNDPVLFLEHKAIYRQPFAKSPEPDSDYLLPFGKAKVVEEGSDVTVVTYGMMVRRSLTAAAKLNQENGVSTEVVDIRTINPLDMGTILASIEKTGRVLVVHEDSLFAGFGAEICARIAEDGFDLLDAPVRRVAGKDTPVPYAPTLEAAVLPDDDDIFAALKSLVEY